jgi:hypothetical protein
MKLAVSGHDSNDKSVAGLTARNKILNESIIQQKMLIREAELGLEKHSTTVRSYPQ